VGTRRAGVVVLAAVGLLVPSACSAGRSLATRRHSAPTSAATPPPSTPPVSSSSLPTTTSTSVPPPFPTTVGAWSSDLVAGTGGGTVTDLNPTTDAVYALDQAPIGTGPHTNARPLDYDLTTRRVLFGAPISGADAMTVTGGWVWVVASELDGSPAIVVYQLDPTTLAVVRRQTLGAPFSQAMTGTLTATVGGPLWVAGGSTLYALSPTTGAVVHDVSPGMDVSSMSTSPDGSVLYVVGSGDHANEPVVMAELDARNGHTQARQVEEGGGAGSVAAARAGAWVAIRGGMHGETALYRKADLRAVTTPGDYPSPYDWAMSESVDVSDDTLWLVSLQGLACADPSTGTVRTGEPQVPSQIGSVVAHGGVLYGGGTGGLSVIGAPRACFG